MERQVNTSNKRSPFFRTPDYTEQKGVSKIRAGPMGK